MPNFIYVMEHTVRSVIERISGVSADDTYIVNDPYLGGTHLMDVKMVKPFFYRGELTAFLANSGHWPDIGGRVPGGFSTRATEIYQEGLRLPPLRLFNRGVLNREVLDIILHNVRVPRERQGDIIAQVTSLNAGADKLTRLLDRYGRETLFAAINELSDRSEQLMRAHIEKIPDGTYVFEEHIDSDGVDWQPLTIHLDLTVKESSVHVDLSKSSPPCRGPLNSVLSTTMAGVFIGFKHVFPDVPINAGCFRPFTFDIPLTTFLNAQPPRPVSGCAAEVCQRMIDVVLGALGQALPEKAYAGPMGTVTNLAVGGNDPERGYYVFLIIHFTLVGGRVLGSNVSVGQCLTENQLFDESVEDLAYVAGLSTVEAKGEFVEVALEMHFTHLPLVSRSQPALQQRGNQVNMREFLGCQPRVSRRVGDPVAVAGFLQAPVTPPAVGMDQTAWLHTVAHKTHQTRARCVGDMAQTDPPHSAAFQFHRNHNQGFAHKLSPANVLLLAAQVSLVDLDTSAQPFPSQPNHRLPQLRQHQPGRLIAAQTEFTLQTLSAQPCFLGAGQPHCQKPTPQRHPRVVQDGSRSGRGLASAGATEHRASPRRPTLRGRAVRTNESRGPADADQILATGLLAGKPFSELHQMLWKVLAQLPRSSPPTARVQG